MTSLVFRCFSIFVVLCLTSTVVDSKDSDIFMHKAVLDMESATNWIIEEGIGVFIRESKEELDVKLFSEWDGVVLRYEPWIETDRYLARFSIVKRGIYRQILNLHREEIDGVFYEFWLTKVAVAGSWTGEINRSVFYVTKTRDRFGSRKIISKRDQFIESYKISTGNTIRFPSDDLRVLYDMEAWLFPDHYQSSNLDEIKVINDSVGSYVILK